MYYHACKRFLSNYVISFVFLAYDSYSKEKNQLPSKVNCKMKFEISNAKRLTEQFRVDNIPFSSILGSPSVVDRETSAPTGYYDKLI